MPTALSQEVKQLIDGANFADLATLMPARLSVIGSGRDWPGRREPRHLYRRELAQG